MVPGLIYTIRFVYFEWLKTVKSFLMSQVKKKGGGGVSLVHRVSVE